MEADDFLDALLRSRLKLRLGMLLDSVDAPLRPAIQHMIDLVASSDALRIALWLREAAIRWQPGQPVILSPEALHALLAVAVLAKDDGLEIDEGGRFSVGPECFILLIARGKSASQVQREGLARARSARAGRYSQASQITVVCVGQLGPLDATAGDESVVDQVEDANVVDSPVGTVRFTSAETIIAAG